jgi:glycyl-tRNA synthetase beta chain
VKNSRTLPLLVELGCEEIPARFLEEAQQGFGLALYGALRESALVPMRDVLPKSYSTPRRLVVWAPEVLERQEERVQEITGPPVTVAYDAQGKPTRAAESFAKRHGLAVADLKEVDTPRGQCVGVKRVTPGRTAADILPEILPRVITSLSFPKSMYWVAKSGPRFVRPIRWILALLGEGKQARAIPFEVAGVTAGAVTYGHRILGKGGMRVQGFEDYAKKLRQAGVEFDSEKRRERVRGELKALLEDLQLTAVKDRWLENWIVNSTEWPTAILGTFDILYQAFPREILVTVMRDHQKYFAIENAHGVLQSRFIAFLNGDGDPKGLIKQGHERVLRARFADALFFWNADQRVTLPDRQPLLDRVTYEAELGSYGEKVRRMKAVAQELCAVLEAHPAPCIPDDSLLPDNERPSKGSIPRLVRFVPMVTQRVLRTVELCKCDLTTQMVQEFPELQGIVGGLYAAAQGESSQVSEAIYDHYLPQGAEDRCPRSIVGAIVSLADKLDGVVGGFAVGREPTGSSDQFALRRQANGIIKVLLEMSLPVDLYAAVTNTVKSLFPDEDQKRGGGLAGSVYGFLTERLRYYMEAVRNLRYDTVRAVLTAKLVGTPLTVLKCALDLERIRQSKDFGALAESAKRIKNILWKSSTVVPGGPLLSVNESLLEDGAEKDLHQAYLWVSKEVETLVHQQAFYKAFQEIASLHAVVARFFDDVLVMADAPAIRENRLHLLQNLDSLFSNIAHFSEIVGGAAHVDASTSKKQ